MGNGFTSHDGGDDELLYTVGVTLHIFAVDEEEMERKLRLLWGLHPVGVFVADWEPVEIYDTKTDEVVG